MEVVSVLDLPREIVARIGDKLGVRERGACRTAHRHFAHIHENRTYHRRTIGAADDAAKFVTASLKLKPRLDTISVVLDRPTEPVDLSSLASIRRVHLGLYKAGDDGYPVGIRGADVAVTLADDAQVNDALVAFLSAQERIHLRVMRAKHSPLRSSVRSSSP